MSNKKLVGLRFNVNRHPRLDVGMEANMALYKTFGYLTLTQDQAFDNNHGPSSATPYSGIYRCMGCGREVVSTEGHPLPPQNHHQHDQSQGSVRWRLIVFADHRPK